ncbi:MAG TPA: hypothetical protein VGD99_04180 [Anaerolineae bacterium]
MTSRLDNSPDDPFKRLRDRLRLYMKEEMVGDKLLDLAKDSCNEFLRRENIILSRTEQSRLLRAVLQDIVDDMLNEL